MFLVYWLLGSIKDRILTKIRDYYTDNIGSIKDRILSKIKDCLKDNLATIYEGYYLKSLSGTGVCFIIKFMGRSSNIPVWRGFHAWLEMGDKLSNNENRYIIKDTLQMRKF